MYKQHNNDLSKHFVFRWGNNGTHWQTEFAKIRRKFLLKTIECGRVCVYIYVCVCVADNSVDLITFY